MLMLDLTFIWRTLDWHTILWDTNKHTQLLGKPKFNKCNKIHKAHNICSKQPPRVKGGGYYFSVSFTHKTMWIHIKQIFYIHNGLKFYTFTVLHNNTMFMQAEVALVCTNAMSVDATTFLERNSFIGFPA